MRQHRQAAAVMASVTVIMGTACNASFAGTTNDAEAGVRAANAQFYIALNKMFSGEHAPMDDIWSHADDTVYMGPQGGVQVGWKQIAPQWVEQASRKMGGKVQPEHTTVAIGKDLAVVYTVETGENHDSKGKLQPVSIRAVNVYRLEGGKWKMIGHHTDKLAFLESK